MKTCFVLISLTTNVFTKRLKMNFANFSWLSWIGLFLFGLFGIFKIFQKKIFAAFCSFMARGPRFVEHKKKLFERLNEQAERSGSNLLKVGFSTIEQNP
jgi:hypothetical protein